MVIMFETARTPIPSNGEGKKKGKREGEGELKGKAE
jgi:hypothetical protein